MTNAFAHISKRKDGARRDEEGPGGWKEWAWARYQRGGRVAQCQGGYGHDAGGRAASFFIILFILEAPFEVRSTIGNHSVFQANVVAKGLALSLSD